jgi:multicomponent Na+:H+ antiporter subunit F
MMSMLTTVLGLTAAALLVAAAGLLLIRIVRGPTVLDRVVALDVLVATLVCGLGLEAALNRHSTTLPILIALSMVGFVGSVSVARYVARDDDDTPDETGAPTTLGVDS